jgi:hypothetical protein
MTLMVPGNTALFAYTKELVRIFRQARGKHEAHHRSRQVLLDMAGDSGCLRAALAAEIQRPGGLNTRHFPAVAVPIEYNVYFNLVMNCFLPLPNGATDVTTNSIHHHGHLLLTTVTTFGPGYEHWRFTTPRTIDRERDLFSIEVIDREMHAPGHAAFVDSFMPHAVIFPPSLTVTFALWSSKNEVTWRDHLKRVRGLEARRESLRKIVRRLGLSAVLGVNDDGYLDFYPVQNGFKGMPKRIQFGRGPNEDFLHTLFHILQQTKNEDIAPDEHLLSLMPVDNPFLVKELVREMKRGAPIRCRFSEGVHWLEHMNFSVQAIEQALEVVQRGRSSFDSIAAT